MAWRGEGRRGLAWIGNAPPRKRTHNTTGPWSGPRDAETFLAGALVGPAPYCLLPTVYTDSTAHPFRLAVYWTGYSCLKPGVWRAELGGTRTLSGGFSALGLMLDGVRHDGDY